MLVHKDLLVVIASLTLLLNVSQQLHLLLSGDFELQQLLLKLQEKWALLSLLRDMLVSNVGPA